VKHSTLKTEYSFIKHIPIVIVMSDSHVSGCAMMSLKQITGSKSTCLYYLGRDERETSGYDYRVAHGMAIISNGVNDTPVRP
jgi:hypothetical protein